MRCWNAGLSRRRSRVRASSTPPFPTRESTRHEMTATYCGLSCRPCPSEPVCIAHFRLATQLATLVSLPLSLPPSCANRDGGRLSPALNVTGCRGRESHSTTLATRACALVMHADGSVSPLRGVALRLSESAKPALVGVANEPVSPVLAFNSIVERACQR